MAKDGRAFDGVGEAVQVEVVDRREDVAVDDGLERRLRVLLVRRVVDAVPARDGREPADAEAVDVGEAIGPACV